jgi:peroxiredoxin
MKAWPAGSNGNAILLWTALLSVVATPNLSFSQSTDQLLNDTAKNYQTLTAFELSGHAIVSIPGSVWQFNGDFTYVVPRMEPSPDGAPSKIPYGVGRVGRMKPVTTVPETTEEPPSHVGFPFVLLSEFGKKMADGVVSVERVGSEALKLNGEDLPCEILKVTYTPSTDEHPHPESVTYWISPAKHLVLKDVLRHSAGRNIESAQWTVIFDSAKFDRPTPQWVLDMANIPAVTERKEWIGKDAPEFTLPASDGTSVTLSSLRGKEVLLDFWSIFCGPCKLEMPMLEDVGREYEAKGVVLLGISIDPTAKSKAWLDGNGRTLRTLTDSEYMASDAYKIPGIPALVLVGRDGRVAQYWEGSVPKATIETALNASLKR